MLSVRHNVGLMVWHGAKLLYAKRC